MNRHISRLILPFAVVVGMASSLSLATFVDPLDHDRAVDAWDLEQLGVPAFNEAISRSVTVYNQVEDNQGQTLNEAASRSVTVYNQVADGQGETIAEVHSRSVTVYNAVADNQGQVLAESHSRAVTVCNEAGFVDDDGDGVHDCLDICPGHPDNVDMDSDGIPDGCDICPTDPGPSIIDHPTGATVCENDNVTFTVNASGTPTLIYQWRKNGVNINGASASMLTINPVAPSDAGSYDVVVSNSCGEETSNPATLTVVTLASCIDPNACTADSCSSGACVNTPTPGAMCDDGDPCTLTDTCDMAAMCAGVLVNCDDMNECTSDGCTNGDCFNTPMIGAMCNDADACTEMDACDAFGDCVGAMVNCDDSNPCTNDSCDMALGCQYVNHTDPCSDNNSCTRNDACNGAGSCVGMPVVILYGDVALPGGNGIVNLDDILCILNGFANPASCPDGDIHPCGGNGLRNLDDILAVLNAFSGNYACPHPCPP